MLVHRFGKYFKQALGVLHRFATEIKPSKLDLDNTSGRNEIMYKYFFILLLFQKTIVASNILTGVVVDIQNQTPIEGVNITCGEEGTTSNSEGQFEIKPDADSISFSHIGFENITVEIKNSMYIKMTRKIIETNEVIVRSSLLKSSPFESSSSLAVFIKKDIRQALDEDTYIENESLDKLKIVSNSKKKFTKVNGDNVTSIISQLEKEMYNHAKNLEFEQAAQIRDQINGLQEKYLMLPKAKS